MGRKDVDAHGPIFDGRASVALKQYEKQVDKELSDELKNKWLDKLNSSIRVNRGVYTSHVRVQTRSELIRDVSDGGVVYGPWLEGTGSRNRSTRFKGYRSLRQATDAVEATAEPKAYGILQRYIGRMN